MAGISSVLNIAKEALLAHQLSVQVASHNVANVDTPGYTRQSLSLSPNQATPISVGNVGNGVHGEMISRHYDRYMTQRIMNQTSTLGNLEAQQEAMRAIDSIFNEAPGLALNDLMSRFWSSWQDLTDNPEIVATRQSVVQQGQLLVDHLQMMNAEIAQARYDIGINLDTAIDDVNSLTSQIAEINVEISNTESENKKANDLRDQRDELVKELSELLDTSYFENSSGSYTVLLADGHSLVDTNEAWNVEWSNNQLYWLSTGKDGETVRTPLGSGLELGGKIGGWLEVRGQLLEGDPTNYLGQLNAFTESLIREVNQQHSQGVGLLPFDESQLGTEMANNTAVLTSVVNTVTANQTIEAGTFTLNDREVGRIEGGSVTNGLAMTKAYNAVEAFNGALSSATASLTTLVAGDAVTALTAGEDGYSIDFKVNDIDVSYTVDTTSPGDNDTDAATLAGNLVDAINQAITNYNNDTNNPIDMTIEAVVGDGTNGGAANSIVLFNTVEGDASRIVLADIEVSDTTGTVQTSLAGTTGLTADSYTADKTHNTGTITLFSVDPINIEAGTDDLNLDQLGLGGELSTTSYSDSPVTAEPTDATATQISFNLNGQAIVVNIPDGTDAATAAATAVTTINGFSSLTGVEAEVGNGLNGGDQNAIVFRNQQSGDTSSIEVDSYTVASGTDILGFGDFIQSGTGITGDTANDGKLTYSYAEHGGEAVSLHGFDYGNELVKDGTSFGIWLYDSDGSPSLPQPVSVSIERANTLYDVAAAINDALADANATGWLTATVDENRLRLTPDTTHQYAFTSDSTNLLQVAGLNTFFTGNSSGTIGVNELVSENLDNIAAAQVTANGEIFRGDNANALAVTDLQSDEYIEFRGSSANTLDGFYNSLVAEIGTRGRTIDRDSEFNTLVLNQMNELRDSTSGVSLDEEMANLIKYQHAYSAAAKLIASSDEMLQTLLASVGIS